VAFLCQIAAPTPAQTAFVDFNAPGQYSGNFNPFAGGGANFSFAESAAGGVGGSGCVSVFQSIDTTATYNGGSWDFSTNGAAITVSTLIKANAMANGGNKIQLGIINVTNNGLNNNPGVAFESFRVLPQGSGVWSLREQWRSGEVIPPETTIGSVNFVVGDWYKFVVSVTNTGGAAGNYTAGCAIYDYGTKGLTPGANIVTFPTLQTHTGQTNVTISAVWPAIRAFQDAGIDAWDDFLVCTPSSSPVFTVPLTNTMVPTGGAATFMALADGPGTITYSWYTNGVLVGGATGSTYTTPPVDNGYTSVNVVAENTNGSATNTASITVFVPSIAVVTNLPASGVQTTTATLNGQVLDTGGDAPVITIYYGTMDGGTNPAAWGNSTALGVQSGPFSAGVTGLSPNTTYYFTALGVNSVGTSWATPSMSLTTLPITLPSVTNLPATTVQATSATLNGQVLDTGNDIPFVTLFYGPTDGGTVTSAWAQSVSLGAQAGDFAQTILGLVSNTTYYFTAAAANTAGSSWAAPSQTFTTLTTNQPLPSVAVLSHHNDNARTGANLAETILNTTNVNTNQFGLVFTRPVDDQIYAQPLVMTNVSVLGRGTHNLVIVATVNDSVYAFDADDASATNAYWQVSFLGANARAPRNSDMTGACGGNYQDFNGNMGIVGTPVIDPASGTIYVVARTVENGSTFVQRLHALNVTNGTERANSPVVITATYPGTGDGSVGGLVPFDPQRNNQRPGLALANSVVYIGWSSHCDWGPYHGWLIGYDATTLQQVVVYNDTPNGFNGGIWMSGQAPAVDASGNLYISTGNGAVDTSGTVNRGESFLKLSRSGSTLTVASWFTPFNWPALEAGDVDLGSGGMLLIPGTTLAFSGGKEGFVYLVNRDNMGGLSGGNADTNVVQSFQVTTDEVHGGATWWAGPGGPYGYIWPSSVNLQQYKFNTVAGMFTLPRFAQSPTAAPAGQPGGLLALSANGTTAGSGIVWAVHQLTGDANQSVRPGILHAYNAQNVTNELWNSEQLTARDAVGNFAKFVPPTVANGKVYLATFSSRLNVYGLLQSASAPQLSVSPASQSFGFLVVSQSSTQTFHVANMGGQTLTGTASTALPFSIKAGSPFSVPVGQTGVVQVVFAPSAAGVFSNAVVFASNGGNSTNTVTGSAVTGPQLAISPGSLNFGTVAVGTNAQANFVLTNLGGSTLSNGVAVLSPGPFTLLSGTPFSLPGFGSTNLVVRFSPASAGSFTNSVVVTSDGGNSSNTVAGVGAISPAANFIANPTSGAWPLTVSFTDNSTGTITNWFWDFGDNTTTNSTVGSLAHTYAGAGTNTVKLTVRGPVGTNLLTRPNYIIVTNLPPVTLTIQLSGNHVRLTWPAGTLQSAISVGGPYTNVPAATSPYTNTPVLTSQYFRVLVR
jgi:PKD repeat protein